MADKKKALEEAGLLPEYYKGRSIFITGASGLMGKVLIERLLYNCPELSKIYMMVRPKRGKSVETRFEEMLKLPLFCRIRDEKPEMFKKLVPVQGDLSLDGLGINGDIAKKMFNEVTVVFHGAATLKLEANLVDAVEMNLAGTHRVIEFCKNMKNLDVFIHVSTAFCHVDKDVLEEKVYEAPYDPMDIMRMVKCMDGKLVDRITTDLIAPHPNTYTFTKRLAERLVAEQYKDLPVCIARPSIVTPAVTGPVPGWVDNLNGPVGILVAAGKGALRSMYCKPEYNAECIPVDYAIHALIAIPPRVKPVQRADDVPVFNITQSKEREVTWGEILELGRLVYSEYPFSLMLWYPDGNMRSNKWVHNICAFFLHWVPAYFIDFMMLIFRQKRFMIHVQTRISQGLEVLQYFTTHRWHFKNEKFLEIRDEMHPDDKERFLIDFYAIEDAEYLKYCILGARQYCMKDPLETLPRARRTLKILYVADKLVHFLFYMLVAYYSVYLITFIRTVFDYAGDNLKNFPFIRTFVSQGNALVTRT